MSFPSTTGYLQAVNTNVAFVLSATATVVAWLLYRRYRRSRDLNLPFLKFEDGDDSRQRYVADSGKLFKIGYEKYLKHGRAFALRNYVDELRPQVYLPLKYLAELKTAPESKLSFPYFSEMACISQIKSIHSAISLFSQDSTGMAKQTDEAAHVLRTDLNRNLPHLYPGLEEESALAVEKLLPPSSDWAPVNPYPVLAYIVARLSARVVGGPELCRNDEYLNLCINVTQSSMIAAHALRATWPQWARWAARYTFPPVKQVLADRRRAAEILRPVLEARKAALAAPRADEKKADKTSFNDGVQWLVDYYQARRQKLTAETLAQHELFYALASIHGSTAIALSILYDLLDEQHWDARAVIIQEIEAVRKEYPHWNRPALAKLVKLDSFMKESQRVHFVGHARVTRAARVPYTFKDGLHLPAGTMVQILHSGTQHDGDFFENPDKFDPWRFLRRRQSASAGEVDAANKWQFASLSDIETNFGAGFHACPARNYATDAIKLVLVRLLTQYDLKFAKDDQTRPPDTGHDSATLPDLATQILFRAKAEAVSQA